MMSKQYQKCLSTRMELIYQYKNTMNMAVNLQRYDETEH